MSQGFHFLKKFKSGLWNIKEGKILSIMTWDLMGIAKKKGIRLGYFTAHSEIAIPHLNRVRKAQERKRIKCKHQNT